MNKGISAYIISLIFLLAFQSSRLNAQALEGTIRYLKTQNWSKMMASVDYISKQRRDRETYMWGTRSEWKTFTLLHFNTTESKYEDSEEEAEPGMEGWSNRKETFFIKRNFSNNTIYDGVTLLGKTYLIQDSIIPQPWKILNDMKEVAGHICMNASMNDTIRKQITIAWFALDMPVSAGPDRFTGLPGMILGVALPHENMSWFAKLVTDKALAPNNIIPPKKGKPTDNKGLLSTLMKVMKN